MSKLDTARRGALGLALASTLALGAAAPAVADEPPASTEQEPGNGDAGTGAPGTETPAPEPPENSLERAVVSGLRASYAYTGKAVEPRPVVSMGDATLVEGADYALSYADNVEAGTATVTMTGKGAYVGKVAKTFEIRVVYQPDSGRSNYAGCAVVGLPGSYETSAARKLVDRVNEIRKEAADLGYVSSYTPVAWSDSLEYAAQIRAAEAAFGGEALGHTRPSDNDSFSVEGAGDLEALSWTGSVAAGVESWYAEKDAYERHLAGDETVEEAAYADYLALLDARYIGLSSFHDAASGATAQAACISSHWDAPAEIDKGLVGDEACVQQVYVKKHRLEGSYAGDLKLALGEGLQTEATLTGSDDKGDYGATSPIMFRSTDDAVATVDDEGVVTGHGHGHATIVAFVGDWVLGTVDVSVAEFSDVPRDEWCYPYVNKSADLGYMNGYDDGSNAFGPNDTLTRGQAARLMFNMAGNVTSKDPSKNPHWHEGTGWETGFTDVDGNQYYAEALAWARDAGIASGYGDGTFHPDANITREEFVCLLGKYATAVHDDTTVEFHQTGVLDEFNDSGDISDWARPSVAWAKDNAVVDGVGDTGTFLPGNNVTRAETAKMIVRYQPEPVEESRS